MVKANVLVALFVAFSAFAADSWQSVDAILGQQGKSMAGDVHPIRLASALAKVNVAR